MVQIIPRVKSSGDRFSEAFANMGQSASQLIPQHFLQKQERQALGDLIGQDLSHIRDQDFLKQVMQHGLQQKSMQQQQAHELSSGLMDYDTVKKFAGQDVADFYKAAPVGGKTKIVQAIVDSLQRGEKFGDMLGGAQSPTQQEPSQTPIEQMAPQEGFQPNEKNQKLNLPDYNVRPQGFTPKEWADQRTGWSKNNLESLNKSRDRLKASKRDILGTKKLQKLNESKELPEGLERWIINPKTGEPYQLAQLTQQSPTAAQEWVKEVSRFANRAKDAFGSRVTNFDLYQYMKQFPNLLNTADGRRNILRMMEINYDLDSLYDSAVQRILDQKGTSNIPPEEVDRIARGLIQNREQQLFDEYLNLEGKNDQSFIGEGSGGGRPRLEDIFK